MFTNITFVHAQYGSYCVFLLQSWCCAGPSAVSQVVRVPSPWPSSNIPTPPVAAGSTVLEGSMVCVLLCFLCLYLVDSLGRCKLVNPLGPWCK